MFANYVPFSLQSSKYSVSWTVFYWYFALAPAVGTFIVNVSNGKTIREIILGSLLIGSIGCFLHIGILNSSIYLFENNIFDAPQLYENGLMEFETIIVETLSSLNFGFYLLIMFGLISIVFYVQPMILLHILATAAMKNFKIEPSRNLVIFAVLLVIQPALIMFIGGRESFKWL